MSGSGGKEAEPGSGEGSPCGAKGEIRRPRRRLLRLAVLLAAAVLLVVNWSWIDAQARAAVVLSSVLGVPVLTPAVEAVTPEPVAQDTEFEGMPALVARPKGEGPWPALLFVNGMIPEGRELPEVQNLARGLARAGYLVVVPDLPGLRTDEITGATIDSTVDAARATADLPDAEGGKAALVGVSTGATLALLAAQDTETEGRVSVVAGVAPYTDIETVLNVATTGHYQSGEGFAPHVADPFLSYAIARSLVAALPPGEDRDTLRAELAEVNRLHPDPLASLRDRPASDLGPEARAVVELLANEEPESFDGLYRALSPDMRGKLDRISPLAGGGGIRAPVHLATGANDKYFPLSESFAVEGIAPDSTVTVTEALDHAEFNSPLEDVPSFALLDGFVVRSLREARSEARR